VIAFIPKNRGIKEVCELSFEEYWNIQSHKYTDELFLL